MCELFKTIDERELQGYDLRESLPPLQNTITTLRELDQHVVETVDALNVGQFFGGGKRFIELEVWKNERELYLGMINNPEVGEEEALLELTDWLETFS